VNQDVFDLLPYAKRLYYPQVSPQTVLEIAPQNSWAKDILADGISYEEVPSPYDESFLRYADVFACLNVTEQDWDVYVQKIKQNMFPISILVAVLPAQIDVRQYFQTLSSFMVILDNGTTFVATVIAKEDE
jgi:hypothetical protein